MAKIGSEFIDSVLCSKSTYIEFAEWNHRVALFSLLDILKRIVFFLGRFVQYGLKPGLIQVDLGAIYLSSV